MGEVGVTCRPTGDPPKVTLDSTPPPRYTVSMIRPLATVSFWYFSYPKLAEAGTRLI